MTDDKKAQAAKIAALNDRMRQAWGMYPNSSILITEGVSSLPDADRSAICEKVQRFTAFDRGNDPYHEHDFGAFEHNGTKVFWKIDYYAPDLIHGSSDPADPSKTVRVLTIMLASEY